MMASFSMQITPVRRNLYQAVIICDPSSPDVLKSLAFIHNRLLEADAPLQLGMLVAADSSELGVMIAHHFAYLKDNQNKRKAFEFLFALGKVVENNPNLSETDVVSAFNGISKGKSKEMESEIS